MSKSNKYRNYAVKLLHKVFKGQNGRIVSMKEIHNGYTNISYVVGFENKTFYQVRIPHCGDLINREAEYQVLSLIKDKHYVYFDRKTGIAIKEWIKGKNPKIKGNRGRQYLNALFTKIKQLHKIPVPKKNVFLKTSFDQYNEFLFRLKFVYQQKYLNLIDLYQDDPVVISHTDINPQNILVDGHGSVTLIDYEWVALAPDYWDYANFVRETRLWYARVDWEKYIPNFDMDKLKNYLFLTSVYAYLWSWAMPQTRKMIRYRHRALRQVVHYSHGVIKRKNEK